LCTKAFQCDIAVEADPPQQPCLQPASRPPPPLRFTRCITDDERARVRGAVNKSLLVGHLMHLSPGTIALSKPDTTKTKCHGTRDRVERACDLMTTTPPPPPPHFPTQYKYFVRKKHARSVRLTKSLIRASRIHEQTCNNFLVNERNSDSEATIVRRSTGDWASCSRICASPLWNCTLLFWSSVWDHLCACNSSHTSDRSDRPRSRSCRTGQIYHDL